MFQRDLGASDESDPSAFAWPSGFRRTNFTPSSESEPSAPSTSSPFRAGRPHFAAERKSSDQVIQSLRDELDRHRQMFFHRLAPQWDQQRAGFPFADGVRRVFADASERAMPPHRFPHEDIPSWMTEDEHPAESRSARRQRWPSGGSARSAASSSSTASSSGGGGPAPDGGGAAETEMSESPGRGRMHKPATRSATGDFPAASPGSPKTFNRAGSAPPQPEATASASATATSHSTGVPRRGFVVTQPPSDSETHSPGTRRRASAQQQPANVRHIPIMVEGRDEPLLPSVAEEEQLAAAAEKRSKTAIPMPFYETAPTANETSDATSGTSAPKQAKVNQKEEEHDGTIPIPLPYDRLSDDATGGGSSASHGAQRRTAADLEQISRIQRESETLLPRIESFRGDRHHRDFLYLDEMLTRLLLKLDNVQVEGRDDVRQARKEAIATITRCINLLESKLLDSIDRTSAEPDSSAAPETGVASSTGAEPPHAEEATTAPAAPPPVTHVTQLVINIGGGGPPAGDEPNEPVQEVN